MCPHYGAIHQWNLPEPLVTKAQNTYLPMLWNGGGIGDIAMSCNSLQIHSKFPYLTDKKVWFKCSLDLDIPWLQSFGENPTDIVSEGLKQARTITRSVYTSTADDFKESNLGKLSLRTHNNVWPINVVSWSSSWSPLTEAHSFCRNTYPCYDN